MDEFTLSDHLNLTHAFPAESVCARYARDELVRLLQRLHTRVNVTTRACPGDQFLLCLAAGGGSHLTDPGPGGIVTADGYMIRVRRDGVVLSAPTAKGLLNAVYDLAEQLGYVFLMPGDEGEGAPDVVPYRPQLKLGNQLRNPQFPFRGVFGGVGTWPCTPEQWLRYFAKLRFNAVAHLPGDEWLPLARELGMRVETGGHGMAELLPRELFAEKPELFRLFQPEDFGGKRLNDSNFCPTHPETQRLVKDKFRDNVRSAHAQGVYAIHAWADDLPGGGWCMCSRCRAFSPSDQAMLAMRLQADAIREENVPMRVPIIAYHDTMYPGNFLAAPKEGFLLYAPRERCYGHALNDPACARNQWYLGALKAWRQRFGEIGDAHTFEYYFDQILFRGLYPFLPNVILGDLAAYRDAGIESYMSLQVGGPLVAPEYNMLLFAQAQWDKDLTARGFIASLARRLAPRDSRPWEVYLQERSQVFEDAMRLCEYPVDIYFDYRWLPETTQDFGGRMARVYAANAKRLEAAADRLAASVGTNAPSRASDLAKREASRARFEAADLRVMAQTQAAMCRIADFHNTGQCQGLVKGLDALREAVAGLDVACAKGKEAGLPDNAYYFALNQTWLKREFEEKLRVLQTALTP